MSALASTLARDGHLPSLPQIEDAPQILVEDLRPNMTDDCLNPHTCSSCQILILGDAPGKFEHEVSLSHMFSASESGCDFFKWCVDQLDPAWGRPRDGRTWKSAVESAGQMETVFLSLTFCVKERELVIQPCCKAPVPIGRGLSSSRPFIALTREGDPAARVFLARPVNRIVRSLRGILNDNSVDSYRNENDLATARVLQSPTRLIDLGLDESSIIPRLVAVESGQSASYAALSYCWGGPQELCTTLATLITWQHEIPYARLPKTLQDACFVTRKLGLRYLWIDALCIIQDSEDDINHELFKMRDIYCGSAVTILASRANNVQQGFLHDREVDYGRTFELPYIVRDAAQPGTVIFCKEQSVQIISTSEPLDMRAWALQERLLSPRIVEFGNLQTSWRSSSMIQVDGGWGQNNLMWHNLGKLTEYMLNSVKALKKLMTNSTSADELRRAQVWSVLVQEYTSRNFTMASDKLPAISGLAETYEASLCLEQPLKYIAGIWQHHLPEGLLWSRLDPFRSDDKYSLRESSTAPSWSWASVNGKIGIPSTPNVCCQRISTTVVSAAVDLFDIRNRFGRVKSGHLILKGPIFKARCNPFERRGQLISLDLGNTRFGSVTLDAREGTQSDDIDVWCIEICVKPCTGLVLKVIDRRLNELGVKHGLVLVGTEELNTFKRIGSYAADLRTGEADWDAYMRWFELWDEREIKLV